MATAILGALASLLPYGVAAAAELVIPGSGYPEYVLGVVAREFNARQNEHRVLVHSRPGDCDRSRRCSAITNWTFWR